MDLNDNTEIVYDKLGHPLDIKKLRELLKQKEEEEKEVKLHETGQPREINKQVEKIEEKKPLKLNLACGQIKQEGFVGVDKYKTDAADIVHDLNIYPWPFEDNSIDEILCSHYIEHTKDLDKFMDEIYRIMKKPYTNEKGDEIKPKVTIIAPYYSSIRAWQDPHHVRAISEFTFAYYNKNWRDQNKLNHGEYDIKADFDFVYGYTMNNSPPGNWASRDENSRTFAIKHYINVIDDIHVTLTKK